jgi:hypothetical protein|tara:strand:+ start:275 stop:610 length:336 start_codon:yes stop_codon:yes gene_type:complete
MENKLSDKIIELVENKIGVYPSLIQSGWYTKDVVMSLLGKNKEIWGNSFIDDEIERYEGVIEYTKESSYIYYKRKEDESTYWLVCLTNEKGKDGILFFINGIKKQKIKLKW